MSDVLHAWVDGGHVGVFRRARRRDPITFSYDDGVSVPLSVSLPLDGRWPVGAPGAFLDNLLPDDSGVRSTMASKLGVYSSDLFGMLDAVDSTGGVVFTRADELPTDESEYFSVDDGMLATQIGLIERMPHTWWSDAVLRPRFSLGGMQGKFSLTNVQGQWYWPDASLPSTHIVKPSPRSLADAGEIEHAVMRLAGLCGLPAPRSGMLDVMGRRAYMVERFDREVRDGAIHRLRQEDFLQAMGLPADRKYEVGVDACLDMLHRVDGTDALSYEWLERYAFSIFTANSDAHAKNYSLMADGDGYRLAPVYDAIATRYWSQFAPDYAMPMDADDPLVEHVTPWQWENLARRHGLDPDRVVSTALDMSARVIDRAPELSDCLDAREFDKLMACLQTANASMDPTNQQNLVIPDDLGAVLGPHPSR